MMTGRAQKIDRAEMDLFENDTVIDKGVITVLDGGAYLFVGDGKTGFGHMRVHVGFDPPSPGDGQT